MSDSSVAKFQAELAEKVDELMQTEFVCIPHQSPPFAADSELSPPCPEDGDRFVEGDHDFHSVWTVGEALFATGHQGLKAQVAAERCVRLCLGSWFIESFAVEYLWGKHIDSRLAREVMDLPCMSWHGVWPVIDAAGLLTGEVSEGGEDMSSVDDEAMIRTEDAVAAGWTVDDDGYATPPIVYWWQRKRWPLNSIDDVLVVRDDEWDSEYLGERPRYEDACAYSWHRMAMPDWALEDDGYINSELGLDGELSDADLIMDALIIRAALIVEARINPGLPDDPVYDCPWTPSDIDDGGSDDEPSNYYLGLQSFCAHIYVEMSQRLSEQGVELPKLLDW